MATTTQTRSCWVNAGERAVVFNPIDGKGWNHPVFVNASNELRIALLNAMAPTNDAPKGYTLSVEVSKSELTRTKTSKGEPAFKFDASDLDGFLRRVLPTRRVKGSLNDDRKSTCENVLAEYGIAVNWEFSPAPRESNQTNSTDIFDG